MARIDRLLADARARIEPRVEPDALESTDALVVDIRPSEQRERDGELPGALVVPRNVLEWRLDPESAHRIPEAVEGRRVVIVCDEGYQSSLAAATLCELGVDATDLAGGYQAWLGR
jgi:rhodanese-related sulfurtransferase